MHDDRTQHYDPEIHEECLVDCMIHPSPYRIIYSHVHCADHSIAIKKQLIRLKRQQFAAVIEGLKFGFLKAFLKNLK